MAQEVQKKGSATPAVAEDIHPIVRLIMDDPTYSEEADMFSMTELLLQATSPEELLADSGSELTSSKDVVGKPFMLHSVRFRPGDLNPEVPAFAILEVTWDGEESTDLMSCSGLNVMVSCKIMKDRGWLPRMVVITQSEKKTRAGYYPLNLRAADVVDGKAF